MGLYDIFVINVVLFFSLLNLLICLLFQVYEKWPTIWLPSALPSGAHCHFLLKTNCAIHATSEILKSVMSST